ncbi:MAG TPA: SDR family NAD(P)-dependent oxidoreductase [Candidatus Dormibacteraeota bacterium]|nr:SDR family NAD(P)-dependent oxidoreductase [Candidatus Dormibacteraeota bacterium]
MDIAGKVALVTGASRGVGRAVAIALAQAGADVACAARATDGAPLPLPGTVDETVRAVEAAGRRGLAVPTNLADPAQVERMVATTVAHFGRVDILINNAAITFPGDLALAMKRYDLIMAVNLRAPLQAMQLVADGMRARRAGAIVNVSSAAALFPVPGLMAYGMSKAAMERMTIDCAEQLRPFGVAVNTFRIDVPVASEGFVANLPDLDHDDWEPTEVPADGILWMLRQPPAYTGHNVGMVELRARHGIMPSRAKRPFAIPPDHPAYKEGHKEHQ